MPIAVLHGLLSSFSDSAHTHLWFDICMSINNVEAENFLKAVYYLQWIYKLKRSDRKADQRVIYPNYCIWGNIILKILHLTCVHVSFYRLNY